MRQHWNIFGSFPECGHTQRDDVDSEIKIAAKFLLPHQVKKVAMSSRDQADIHLPIANVPQPSEAMVFQHLQEFGLNLQVDVPNFVQKYRAPIGNLEQSLLAALRAGEGAFLMAK